VPANLQSEAYARCKGIAAVPGSACCRWNVQVERKMDGDNSRTVVRHGARLLGASGSDADKMVAREQRPADSSPPVTSEDVARLAQALREAKRAHAISLAELRQADVDPVEDGAVWYAEYLLGVR